MTDDDKSTIRFLGKHERDPLSWRDVETLRQNEFFELADIAENILKRQERKLWFRFKKWLRDRD